MEHRNGIRSLNSETWYILAGWFLFQFSFFGLWYTLFNLYLLRLGYSARFIGTIGGGALLIFALMCVPAGLLGARYGSRRTMIIGLLICLSFRTLLLAGPSGQNSLGTAWLLTAYFCSALGSSIYMVNSVPALSAATNEQTRGVAFSAYTAAAGLGTFTGSLVGGIVPGVASRVSGGGLADPGPYRGALFLVPLLMLASAALATCVRGEALERTTGSEPSVPAQAKPWSLIIGMALVWLLFQAARGPVFSFYNVYLDRGLGVPVSMIGSVMAFANLVSIPAILAAPVMAKRVGRVPLVKISMLAVAAGCLLLSVQNRWTAAAAYAVILVALGVAGATYTPLSQDAVGKPHRAVMSGFINHTSALGMTVMTFGGGVIIDALGFKSLFLCAAALPVLSIALYSLSSCGRARPVP